ncbi:hypothetical protein GOODEAATRI_016146 [Goodea atripinnis]|uniref:Uncharacterized protein n=1 Tax=Goodea atripinnis TaxID=208336 RepID=A0ABV0MSH5_9TELE
MERANGRKEVRQEYRVQWEQEFFWLRREDGKMFCVEVGWVVVHLKLDSSTRGLGALGYFCSIAVPRTAFFLTEFSNLSPGICCSPFSSVELTLPIAPLTTGTTVAFTCQALIPEALVFLHFLMFVFSDVSLSWDGHIDHSSSSLLLISDYNIQVVGYLVGLDLEVPHNLNSVIFHHVAR